MRHFNALSENRLFEILTNIKKVNAVLIGDLCLDVYWSCDMTKSVLSRETPHFPLPVTEERMAPGAGGNALNNMAVLCDNVSAIGVIGEDWRGVCLKKCLNETGIDSKGIVEVKNRMTNAYCKPMRRGYLGFEVEDPRIDFESFAKIDIETEDALIENLKKSIENADLLCVSDQFEFGCITERVRETINELAKNILTVVDSRSRISLYKNAILKPNEIECARALEIETNDLSNDEEILQNLKKLSQKTNSDICLTLGDKGVKFFNKDTLISSSGVKVSPPIDTCGAGDCYLSAFSLALASGASYAEAAALGNLASAICVKKINTTGSASDEEIIKLFMDVAENE